MSVNSATALTVLGSATLSYYGATSQNMSLPVVAVSNVANETMQTATSSQPAMTTNTAAFLSSTQAVTSPNSTEAGKIIQTPTNSSKMNGTSVTARSAVEIEKDYSHSECWRLLLDVSRASGTFKSVDGGVTFKSRDTDLLIPDRALGKVLQCYAESIETSSSYYIQKEGLRIRLARQLAKKDKELGECQKSIEAETVKLTDCQASKESWKAVAAVAAVAVVGGGVAAAYEGYNQLRVNNGNVV